VASFSAPAVFGHKLAMIISIPTLLPHSTIPGPASVQASVPVCDCAVEKSVSATMVAMAPT
jgi:hypothetical protein